MRVSIGGDSGLYVFGTLGFLKTLEKLGLKVEEYRCCGLSCIPLSLSLLYSSNRAYNVLARREPVLRKIFGWVYSEGIHVSTSLDVIKIMASAEIKRIPIFNRDRVPSIVEDIFPDVKISDVGNLGIGVMDVEEGNEVLLKGDYSLREALVATLRFTPFPENLRFVSCTRAVVVPEGDLVLDLRLERKIPLPRRAVEVIMVALQARRDKVRRIRLEMAKKAISMSFKYFPRTFELFSTVYKKSLRELSEGIE